VHDWGQNQHEYWFHPLMHILVPQRASLWSMPFCYWALLSLVHAVEAGDTKLYVLAGILIGFTPLIQIHSFVALAQWSITFCILNFPCSSLKTKNWNQTWKYLWQWAIFAIVANCLALPQFYPYLNRLAASRSQFLQINPIWRTPERENLQYPALILWWRGLGVFWAMSILGIALLSKRQFLIYVPSLIVYGITNIIRYQPWELDNTKLFYAAWIPLALPVTANFLYKLGRRRIFFFLIAVALLIISCASSFIHTRDCLRTRPFIFSLHDFKFGYWISENTDTKSVFLTSSWHPHPCGTIAGRQLFMGYGGWVASHGLDYWGRNSELGKLQNDPGLLAQFRKYNIKYAISRFSELRRFKGTDATVWKKIYEDRTYSVWRFVDGKK
jgi:hypothetical protein